MSKAFLNVDKLNDLVNVRDFGAVGDGVADDAAAVQAAFDAVEPLGGTLYFPPGKYLFGSQVTLNRTYAPSGSNFVGERNLKISGYGAEIRTTGAIYAFRVEGGWAPNHCAVFEGFTIYHRGNTTALGGIQMVGAGLVTCRNISVVVSSSLPAGYAAFRMENGTASDPNTGCFWNHIDHCSIRPWAGAEGYSTYGVLLIGAANATHVTNCMFSGSNTHVQLQAHLGQTYVPNAVVIDGNAFEAPNTGKAIVLTGSASTYHVSGTRITNNRFEALNTAVELNGTGTTVQLPTYMSGNYADTSVTNYLVNTLNIPVIMLDATIVGADMGPGKFQNQDGFVFRNEDSAFDTLVVRGPNIGSGLAIHSSSGVRYGRWALQASQGTLLKGRYSGPYAPINLGVIQGISSTDTESQNLTGGVTFTSAATKAVTFPIAEPDTSYRVFVSGDVNETFWVTSKTTSGFTINSSNATSTANVNWFIIR